MRKVKKRLQKYYTVIILKKDLIVYDVIYDPNPTPLIDDVNSLGLTTFNGSAMNFEQAVIGFSYSITSGVKDIDYKKIIIAMKIKETMKIPLTICNMGLINFSETLEILSNIFEDKSWLLSVRKKS